MESVVQTNNHFFELNTEETMKVDGGVLPQWIVIAGTVGGLVATANELWKFSGGFVQGFKDGLKH